MLVTRHTADKAEREPSVAQTGECSTSRQYESFLRIVIHHEENEYRCLPHANCHYNASHASATNSPSSVTQYSLKPFERPNGRETDVAVLVARARKALGVIGY